jgi:hypothetical protein
MLTFVFVMLHYFLGFMERFGLVTGSTWSETLTYFSTIEHMHSLSNILLRAKATTSCARLFQA